MAERRKTHKWTENDLTYLRNNINKLSWDELSENIGVTVIACKRKAKDAQIRKMPVLKKINNKIAARPTHQDSMHRMFNTKPTKRIKRDDSDKVPFRIPELNLTVYVKPGFDPEEIRRKYLFRK